MISEEMNKNMTEDVMGEELEKIIYFFQKSKSPSPNRFTIEFYQGFYDLLKLDLLKVVREYQRARKVIEALNTTFFSSIP